MLSEFNRGPVYSVDTNDINSFNDLEMSKLLVEMIKNKERTFYEETFVTLARKCQKERGQISQVDLVFLGDDLGSNEQEMKSNLRYLKAIIEDSVMNKYIKNIVVKSPNPDFTKIEPNVFCSGVTFQKIEK